jgi:hypothetical protein
MQVVKGAPIETKEKSIMIPRTPRQTGQQATPRQTGQAATTAVTPAEPGLPPIPKALLDALKLRFPFRRPRLGQTLDAVMFTSGCQSIIELLEQEYEMQTAANIFTSPVLSQGQDR